MSVNLSKGQKISLKKEDPTLKSVYVGLGWDPAKSGSSIDIDASVIAIDTNRRRDSVVYYANLSEYGGGIRHMGDNLTGDGDGDDETVFINLDAIPAHIAMLSVIINIYCAFNRDQNFGMINNTYVHVVNSENGKEIVRYNLDDKMSSYAKATGLFVADLYRDEQGEWQFKAVGEPVVVRNIDEMVTMKVTSSQGTSTPSDRGFFRRLFGG